MGSFVIDMFGKLDKDSDSHLDYDEFCAFYNSILREKAIKAAGSEFGKGSALHGTYLTFAAFGKKGKVEDMEGKNFAKLCKDCKVGMCNRLL